MAGKAAPTSSRKCGSPRGPRFTLRLAPSNECVIPPQLQNSDVEAKSTALYGDEASTFRQFLRQSDLERHLRTEECLQPVPILGSHLIEHMRDIFKRSHIVFLGRGLVTSFHVVNDASECLDEQDLDRIANHDRD